MKPEDKGGLRCHKSIATVLSLLYTPPDLSAQRRRSLQKYMLALVTEINVHRCSIFRVRSGLLFAIRSMLCAWTDCSRVCVRFTIYHAQLSRPSLPLQTSSPSPPPASKLSKRFKFAKEEKLSHVKSLLKAWFLKE